MIKINDKVRVVKQKQTKNYKNTCGKEGFVVYIDYGSYKYGVEFPDIKNPASSYGRYYFEEGEIELVEENKITLGDIVSKKLTCIIHTPNKKDAICVVDEIPSSDVFTTRDEWLGYWDLYREDTCYNIVYGKINAYCEKRFYEERGDLIYEFSDLFASGGVVPHSDLSIFKEEKKMPTFTITEGTREVKIKNSKPMVIETVSTTVRTELGQATTTCDKSDSYDIYTGALVAAAKITAHKSEEAMLMYNLAMNMWGTETSAAILKTLADRAMGGSFENVYKKWQRQIEQEEKLNAKKAITCSICGRWCNEGEDGTKYPFTPAEKEEHEKWHQANRKAKRIRYQERSEAKKRIAEAEREGRITEYIAEIVETRKKESCNND